MRDLDPTEAGRTLVVWLTGDQGSHLHVQKLIDSSLWHKIIVIGSKDSLNSIKLQKQVDLVSLDLSMQIPILSEEIGRSLSRLVTDFEVYVNFVSGSGKEHMALLSALIRNGLAIRLVAMTPAGVKEI